MAFVTRKTVLTLTALPVVVVLALGGYVWSGSYNVAADDPHTGPVYAVLETVRDRSIATRASRLQVPGDLQDPARITQGAGNYNAMCMGCHLAPGMAATEMSRGLYPAPPDLSKETVESAAAFWVIKHGIKASGMPAWGKNMSDEYIWNMAAFLQELPKLSPEQFQAMVASSGGHDHGGGETEPHGHAEGVPDDHGDMPMEGMPANESAPHPHPPGTPAHDDTPADPHAGMDMGADAAEASPSHPHPPGTPADHHEPAASAEPAAAPASPMPATNTTTEADDGHDHQH